MFPPGTGGGCIGVLDDDDDDDRDGEDVELESESLM
jgi:hypothetical protein